MQKNSQRPFVVETEDGQARAVGTAFTVEQQVKQSQVAIIEGIVEVSAHQPHPSSHFKIGEIARIDADGVHRVLDKATNHLAAWREGYLIFDNTPLSAVLKQVNRHRPGKVMLLNNSLKITA